MKEPYLIEEDMFHYLKAKAVLQHNDQDLKYSNRKNKEYQILYNNNWIHFGDKRYADYLIHKDEERRPRYRKRASKIKDKAGNLTFNNKNGPNYWSYHLLW